MRILFNHGLTAGELYTNTPKSITNRPWRWWIRQYGWTSTYEDTIADPFKYCLGLILNKVIDEKVRFKIPDYFGFGKGVSQGFGSVKQIIDEE